MAGAARPGEAAAAAQAVDGRDQQPQVGETPVRRDHRVAHTVTLGCSCGEDLLPDPTDLTELVDRGEPAVLGAPVDDPLRQDRADAGQLLELGGSLPS